MIRKPHIPMLAVALTATASAWSAPFAVTGPEREGMLEGETYRITWEPAGMESVSVVATGERTEVGGRSRGTFVIPIAEGIAAEDGGVDWTVPWIDAVDFTIKVKGYDPDGLYAAYATRDYDFRPAVLKERMDDGIYLDLSDTENQRLYVQKDYRLQKAYLTTSSQNYLWRAPGAHIPKPHDHKGVFSVLTKDTNHWSTLYDVTMRWAMRYHGGHFIHATSSNLYDELGQPASHGCNRLTRNDARELYHSTPLGTRVEVIGPEG